ncbi:MAG: Uma2 family endonuclease [Armatimonadetes bacterium]|nr:Uma2 family endonuclease [Armatimonadota bacterium]
MVVKPRRVMYPTEDGKPFSESDWHYEAMTGTLTALEIHFADRSDVYASANNFVYWEQGNPKARIAPDVYVVFGVPGYLRDCYMAWNEGGHLPSFILEATSRKTRHHDMKKKLPLYEQVFKTQECFFFDPKGDYLRPRLQGYRLTDGHYERLEPVNGRLYSEQLGLDFVQEGEYLRLFDPQKDCFLPSPRVDLRRTRKATVALRAAEAEITRLRAELEAFRNRNT